MFINLGRLLMLFVWGILLFNALNPVQPPIHYFLYFILAFMAITNGLKVLMMAAMSAKTTPLSTGQKVRLFLFGVFELKAIFNQQKKALTSSGTNNPASTESHVEEPSKEH